MTVWPANTDLYVEDTLTYTTVTNEAHWQVNVEAVSRNGSTVAVNAASIIDTGTTIIITSEDAAKAYFENIPGSRKVTDHNSTYYTIPCDTIGSYTPTFTFSGRAFHVSEEAFNLGGHEGYCLTSIASIPNVEFWIIGGVFLQGVYTVFDIDNSPAQVGFAKLV